MIIPLMMHMESVKVTGSSEVNTSLPPPKSDGNLKVTGSSEVNTSLPPPKSDVNLKVQTQQICHDSAPVTTVLYSLY